MPSTGKHHGSANSAKLQGQKLEVKFKLLTPSFRQHIPAMIGFNQHRAQYRVPILAHSSLQRVFVDWAVEISVEIEMKSRNLQNR
jgi:hypothetical protein